MRAVIRAANACSHRGAIGSKSGGTVIFDNRPGYIYPGNFYFCAKEEMLCEGRSARDVDGVFLVKRKE